MPLVRYLGQRWAAAAVCSIVILGTAAAGHPQNTGGVIVGQISADDGSGVPAAVVTVVNSAARGTRTVADAKGRFRIAGLEPGTYTVSAERQNFVRVERPGIVVREGLTITVPLSLTAGSIADVVVVRAETPIVDVTNPIQAVNISGDLQRALPLASLGTWADFLLLVPGVATTQARLQTYSSQGAGHASGVFVVDGADATSVLQGSTLYSQFAGNTFNDIHVKTGAVDAASPLGFGPVVNITSRSGTDEWRGTAVAEYQPKSWNDRNTPSGQDLTVVLRQQDVAIGGPLVTDRAWFFGSARVSRNATGVARSAQEVSLVRQVAPGFKPFDNGWSGAVMFAKLNVHLSSGQSLLGSFTHDVVTLGGAQPNEAATFREVVVGGPGVLVRATSAWTNTLFSEVAVSFNGKKQRNANLQPDTTGVQVHQAAFPSAGRLIGTGPIAAINASSFPGTDFDVAMWTINADVTHMRSGVGIHVMRGGLYAQPVRRNRWVSQYNNGGFQLEEATMDGDGRLQPFHRQIFDVGELTTRHVDTRDIAGYLQDMWTVAERLTVTAGLRLDRITRTDRLFQALTQRTTAIGPRLGVAYRPTADGTRVVRGSWGRVHENLTLNDTVAGTTNSGVRDLYDTAFDGSFSTVIVSPPRTARSADLIVDLEGYHQSYADELLVGYRQQFAGLTTIDVAVGRRDYRDRPALIETNARYEGDAFVGYGDESQNGIYRLTSNRWNWPIVTTLQATVTRQTAAVQLLAGYTRSWNRLAGTWLPGDPASLVQPAAFANRHGIGFVNGCTSGGAVCPDSNSLLTGFGGGAWRDHVFNSGVTYRAPGGVQLGLAYTAQSGAWSGPIQTRLDAPDPRFGPPTVTLSNGRVVANPLATTVRFAYATREQGQFRLPAVHLLSARLALGWQFGRGRVETAADVFNLTNAGVDQAFLPTAHQLFSPFFGQGSTRQFPRALKISAGLAF